MLNISLEPSKGVFFYKNHDEMIRDREPIILVALLSGTLAMPIAAGLESIGIGWRVKPRTHAGDNTPGLGGVVNLHPSTKSCESFFAKSIEGGTSSAVYVMNDALLRVGWSFARRFPRGSYAVRVNPIMGGLHLEYSLAPAAS